MEAISAATTAINTIYLLETSARRSMIESPAKVVPRASHLDVRRLCANGRALD
jgi:hypothetical protein